MFGLETLDVGIGMALMFLFVSLIASAVREAIETVMKARAKTLERGIRELLGNGVAEAVPPRGAIVPNNAPRNAVAGDLRDPVAEIYNHPQIAALFRGNYDAARTGQLPSYIPAANFARAVIDIAARGGQIVRDPAALGALNLRTTIDNLPNDRLRLVLQGALDRSNDNLAAAQKEIEQWFDSAMERTSGWYKRRTQYWLAIIGLICAVLMNIDAITVMQTLSADKALRAAVVTAATAELKTGVPEAAAAAGAVSEQDIGKSLDKVDIATARLGSIGWPIGWAHFPDGKGGWWATLHPAPQYRAAAAGRLTGMYASAILGWLVTAVGVTFGAAFWFDVLNKFMVIRSTVKPDEKSPKEKSKDSAGDAVAAPAVLAAPAAAPPTDTLPAPPPPAPPAHEGEAAP